MDSTNASVQSRTITGAVRPQDQSACLQTDRHIDEERIEHVNLAA